MTGVVGESAAKSLREKLASVVGLEVISVGYGQGKLYVYLRKRPALGAKIPKAWKKHEVAVVVTGAVRPAI